MTTLSIGLTVNSLTLSPTCSSVDVYLSVYFHLLTDGNLSDHFCFGLSSVLVLYAQFVQFMQPSTQTRVRVYTSICSDQPSLLRDIRVLYSHYLSLELMAREC